MVYFNWNLYCNISFRPVHNFHLMLNNNKFILNSVILFSFVSLTIAYYIQYILGHKPCNLCLIERIPYFSAVIFIPLIFMISKFEKIIVGIVMLVFIFGVVISFYHVGIEQGFFSESLICNLSNSGDNLSKEQLLQQLKSTPISCKDVTFRFLGLSLASINTIFSLILSYIFFKMFKNYENNK